jgi:hypothetical protein
MMQRNVSGPSYKLFVIFEHFGSLILRFNFAIFMFELIDSLI